MKDQFFNDIADKFAKNIYGTSKGRLRQQILESVLTPVLDTAPMNIIELGGGTGVMSHFMASFGHHVTHTDASPDILAHAKALLADYPDITIRQQALLETGDLSSYDLIGCHAVLEWLYEPFAAIQSIADRMASGSLLSLSFFNRDAALFSNALYGNFDYIARGMKVRNQVRLNPQQPLKPTEVMSAATDAGFTVIKKTGIRCFHDYMKDKNLSDEAYASLLALELQYCQQEPYLWLGKYFHLLLRKN